MDRDTGSDFEIVFECEVCGFQSVFKNESPEAVNEMTEDWCCQHVELKGGVLHIMACPACAEQPLHQIFEGYKARIRAGGNPEYH